MAKRPDAGGGVLAFPGVHVPGSVRLRECAFPGVCVLGGMRPQGCLPGGVRPCEVTGGFSEQSC